MEATSLLIDNRASHSREAARQAVVKLTWLYLVLLLTEGGIRKWFLPGLSDLLLIIRDPVGIGIILLAWQARIRYNNFYIYLCVACTVVAFFIAMILGHGNMLVAFFGARIFLFHFPVLFIIGRTLSLEEVEKIGRFLLWATIGMTMLIMVQFYSPQSAWVNRGVGGNEEGAGFSGAGGFFRPPGTFSFITVLASFYGLVAPFVFYFWLNRQKANPILLLLATFALVLAIPFSISRTILFEVLITFSIFLSIAVQSPKNIGGVVFLLVFLFLSLPFLADVPEVQTALGAFTERFESASSTEGGVQSSFIHRGLGDMLGSTDNLHQLPFWGKGLGMGTKVGSKLISGDAKGYLIAEAEWGRLIGEMGFALGFCILITRLVLALSLLAKARALLRSNNSLPWLMCSFAVPQILTGLWGQPACLGFAVIGAGLLLAATNTTLVNQ